MFCRAIIFALAAYFLAGGAAAEETLRIALSSNPAPLDPALATSAEQGVPVFAAYETLVRRPRTDETGMQPERAEGWAVSQDGLAWTFTIRPGGRFASGAAVDAAAVKFSLDRLIRLGRGPASDLSAVVDRIEVVGAMRLRINLKQPAPRLLSFLADRAASIVDPLVADYEKDDDLGAGWLATRTAGSGPYALREGGQSGVLVLDRNLHYPQAPYFDRIIMREIRDPIARSLALTRDEIDIAVLMPAQTLRRAEASAGAAVVSTPTLAFQNVAFNLERPAFSDLRLRRAAAMAIDAAAIVEHIREGRASVFNGPLPDGMAGATPDLYPIRYDLDAARALATEVLGDNEVRVSMIYPGVSPETDTVAQYLQAQLGEIGLRVRLERLSVPAYIDRIGRGSYDLVLMGFVAKDDDPIAILGSWFVGEKSGLENPARYRNVEIDRLLEEAQSTRETTERAALFRRVAELANADLPYIYLQQTHIAFLVRDDIEGFRWDPVSVLDLSYDTLRRRNER